MRGTSPLLPQPVEGFAPRSRSANSTRGAGLSRRRSSCGVTPAGSLETASSIFAPISARVKGPEWLAVALKSPSSAAKPCEARAISGSDLACPARSRCRQPGTVGQRQR